MEAPLLDLINIILRNRKHVPCFYRVIGTPVKVWENEKCCGNTSRRWVFPKLFRVLPNFHDSKEKINFFTLQFLLDLSFYWVLYNIPSYPRILIGCRLWSTKGQTDIIAKFFLLHFKMAERCENYGNILGDWVKIRYKKVLARHWRDTRSRKS